MEIRSYAESDEADVAALWERVLPESQAHNEPIAVIHRKREIADGLFFVAVDVAVVIGTVMGGYDGHRGWIYSLAVDPKHCRKGIGSTLVRHLEHSLRERGCPKINLQVRASNQGVIAFYKKIGYVVEERISMGKKLYE